MTVLESAMARSALAVRRPRWRGFNPSWCSSIRREVRSMHVANAAAASDSMRCDMTGQAVQGVR